MSRAAALQVEKPEATRLHDKLQLLATAPNGIATLREVILQLAVQGKLVPQDPSDVPASALLKRIEAEKARLVKEGSIKRPKPLPAITEDEKPYDLPQGWEWVRIQDISRDWGQKTPDKEFTYIDVSAIDNSKGKIANPTQLDVKDAPSRARKVVRNGTVIYSTIRPYLLNIAIIEEDFEPEAIASTAFAIVHPLGQISSQFLFWCFRSPTFIQYVESLQTGVAYPAINDRQFFGSVFPLPPLAEQQRIVAKVDELMALCDALEAEQNAIAETQGQLVQASLESLTASTDASAFQANWHRLRQHFAAIFTTEASIDALKATLLQLAVQGKLVPQDPSDAPASALLKRIEAEKARLVKEGSIKRPKPLPAITEDEKPYALPQGWEWVRLGEVGMVSTGGTPRTNEADLYGNEIPFIGPGQITQSGSILVSDKWLSEKGRDQTSIAQIGDILMVCIGGSIGKAAITDKETAFNQQINCLSCLLISHKYAYMALTAPNFFSVVLEKATGSATPIINLSKWSEIPIPLPPLAEQQRIVAKVDELMKLYDQLKQHLTDTRTTHTHLATATAQALTA